MVSSKINKSATGREGYREWTLQAKNSKSKSTVSACLSALSSHNS